MKVRILNSRLPTYWYAEHVGSIIEVDSANPGGSAFKNLEGGGTGFIDADSYEIINEESSMDNEYQIPVLVKADADSGWAKYTKFMSRVRGKVVLCRKPGVLCYEGPADANSTGEFSSGFIPNWMDHDIIPWPTKAQVEEEQAKLKPKADPLPDPVRKALEAADLGCRRDGVAKLIEAMYQNPPKAAHV